MGDEASYESTFVDVLLDDVVQLHSMNLGSGVIRRALIRSIMAAIEGILWNLQRTMLRTAENQMSEFEAAVLREVSYYVTDTGEVRNGVAKIPLKSRVRFGANLLARIHPEARIDFTAREWKKLLDSIDVRDRLTHPKSQSKLEVTTDEVNSAIEGLTWFLVVVSGTWQDALTAYLKTPDGRMLAMLQALRKPNPG